MNLTSRSIRASSVLLVTACAVLVLVCGCAADRSTSTRANTPRPSRAEAATSTPEGLVLSVSLPSQTLVSGTSAIATAVLENSSETTKTIPPTRFSIVIKDASGKTVHSQVPPARRLRHPMMLVTMGPGASELRRWTFTVPPPGRYMLYVGAAGLKTPPLEFEAVAESP